MMISLKHSKKLEIIKEILRKKKTKLLVRLLLNINLTDTEEKIINEIVYGTNDLVITAYTRYGKSYSVAIAIILYILLNRDKRILLIAPTFEQTAILRNYVATFLLKHPILTNMLDINAVKEQRLKKEVSKKRITFKQNISLRMLSAQGDARRLMGHGGDLIIRDEDCLISHEVQKEKILRMKGDNPNARMISIGNPWNRDNDMYSMWINPKVKKIHIPWQIGVKEGRISKEFIDEQKNILSEYEFKVLYDAEFSEESEDQLIRYKWIQDAINKNLELKEIEHIAGLDVAEMGADKSVLIKALKEGNKYKIIDVIDWSKKDTMKTVGKVIKHISKEDKIFIDANGVGKGVFDRLNEQKYNVVDFKSGRKSNFQDRFINMKAEKYWRLRELFEAGQISIPKNNILINELTKMKYELTSSGKIRIIDPEKSPDFADSLMMCCSDLGTGFSFVFA